MLSIIFSFSKFSKKRIWNRQRQFLLTIELANTFSTFKKCQLKERDRRKWDCFHFCLARGRNVQGVEKFWPNRRKSLHLKTKGDKSAQCDHGNQMNISFDSWKNSNLQIFIAIDDLYFFHQIVQFLQTKITSQN